MVHPEVAPHNTHGRSNGGEQALYHGDARGSVPYLFLGIIIHAIIERLPEYFAPRDVPKKMPVPIIEVIDKAIIVP